MDERRHMGRDNPKQSLFGINMAKSPMRQSKSLKAINRSGAEPVAKMKAAPVNMIAPNLNMQNVNAKDLFARNDNDLQSSLMRNQNR